MVLATAMEDMEDGDMDLVYTDPASTVDATQVMEVMVAGVEDLASMVDTASTAASMDLATVTPMDVILLDTVTVVMDLVVMVVFTVATVDTVTVVTDSTVVDLLV